MSYQPLTKKERLITSPKAPYMGIEFSTPALELMSRVKRAFEPDNIINPGKILPDLSI